MEKRPNILLIMTDQQRRNSLGAYGCEYVSTPNLDALAASAIRYDRAYCNAPVCTPSRASVLTGKPLSGHGVYNLFDILPQEERLLSSYLKELGYQTGLVGKLHVSGILFESRRRNRFDGFDVYELSHEPSILLDEPYNAYGKWLRETWPEDYARLKREGRDWKNRPVRSHFSTWVSQRGAQLIRERDKSKPFFLSLGFFDPHSPYDHHPAESEALLHEDKREEIVAPCGEERPVKELEMVRSLQRGDPHSRYTQAEAQQLRRGYFAGVSFLDAQLGRVFDALREEGIFEETMIIFTSDHGDMMFDHNLLGKGAYFYEDCTNVPLIVKYPNQIAGAVNKGLVQLNDLFGTVLKAAGGSAIPMESHPLQDGSARALAVCEYRGCSQMDLGIFPHPVKATMLRGDRYKLNLYHDTLEMQLFDLREDPEELHDLAQLPQVQGTVLNMLQLYLREKAQIEYAENASRGGRSEIPSFSKVKQKLEGREET